MIAPRVLRELSWAASKLRQVAATLSALEVRLTVTPESDSMSGLESIESRTKRSASSPGPGGSEWAHIQIPLRFYEEDPDAR